MVYKGSFFARGQLLVTGCERLDENQGRPYKK